MDRVVTLPFIKETLPRLRTPLPPSRAHRRIAHNGHVFFFFYSDVEGITQKTGSAKKFSVFVKMLLTALGHGSESVFVDLLTYADLVSPLSACEPSVRR